MYSFSHDCGTGGRLNFSPYQMSKEPRPVYASELDMLRFCKYWQYERQNDVPHLWSKGNKYGYRGRLVLETNQRRCA